VSGQLHPRGNCPRYSWGRRLGGPQSWSGREKETNKRKQIYRNREDRKVKETNSNKKTETDKIIK
jgi:hypothetical protein